MFDLSMQSALDIFCYVLVLIYGLALSADLSTGGYVSRQQKYLLTLLCLLFLLMQGLGLVLLGERAVKQLYPLVTHVPLVLILILFMKKSVGVAIVSTCTAYLCCQPPRRFCENHLVNLLCSSFTDKAQRQGAVLTVDASLPNDVAISDTELCSLLSNGLENALHAVADLPADRKQISLYCGVRQNKLLIEIRNPCAGPIAMRDGLPVSDREGHGYGCRSIQAIAQRNGGLCVFSARQGQFLLQIMLPVLET